MIGNWLHIDEVGGSTLIECALDKDIGRIGRKGPTSLKGKSSFTLLP